MSTGQHEVTHIMQVSIAIKINAQTASFYDISKDIYSVGFCQWDVTCSLYFKQADKMTCTSFADEHNPFFQPQELDIYLSFDKELEKDVK